MSHNTLLAIALVCYTIFNLALVAVAVGLSIFTGNFHFLWLLAIPVCLVPTITKEERNTKENMENENE